MRRLFQFIIPPAGWKIPVLILLGTISGLVVYALYVGKAFSYLSDDPKTCVNCHIMAPQYATWNHSSHREHVSCNGCHVPQDNVVNTYFFKAKDGIRHATIFTLRAEPQVIKMHEAGQAVVQQNCIRCHDQLNDVVHTNIDLEAIHKGEGKRCWDCHREVPHGRVNSLSSTPNAKVPLPSSPVPEWIKEALKK